MSDQHRRRRRTTHVKLRKGNALLRAVHAFNRVQDTAFPIVCHVDKRGRRRPVGVAARANAHACLLALMMVQKRGRHGRVYVGYEALGRQFHRSRSTAYRAVVLLVHARLIQAPVRKGGKTWDEQGAVIPRANGYQLHEDLVDGEDIVAPPPRPKKPPVNPRGGLGRRSQTLVDDGLERVERWKRARAGPAA